MKKIRAFSSIELIVVMVVMGILAVTLLGSFKSSQLGLHEITYQWIQDIRYLKIYSLTHHEATQIRFLSLSPLHYRKETADGAPLVSLSDGGQAERSSEQVSIAFGDPSLEGLLMFNECGELTEPALSGQALNQTLSFTLYGQEEAISLLIEPLTSLVRLIQ